ncbi:MAG: hypothetical protein ABSB15_18970 [Bryobacteraceae bacterium]
MRVPLNLAREPFRRDRTVLIATAAGCVTLTVTLILLSSVALSERAQSQNTRVALNAVNRQLTRMRTEQASLENAMRQPANAVVLDRSLLFNDIIRRKSISWTRIFADLETVLPHDVRISAIHPQVNSKDELSLDMTVEAGAPEPVIGFVARLEGSDVFGSTQVSTITLPTQNDPFYRYRLSVTYAQNLMKPVVAMGQISDLPLHPPAAQAPTSAPALPAPAAVQPHPPVAQVSAQPVPPPPTQIQRPMSQQPNPALPLSGSNPPGSNPPVPAQPGPAQPGSGQSSPGSPRRTSMGRFTRPPVPPTGAPNAP